MFDTHRIRRRRRQPVHSDRGAEIFPHIHFAILRSGKERRSTTTARFGCDDRGFAAGLFSGFGSVGAAPSRMASARAV